MITIDDRHAPRLVRMNPATFAAAFGEELLAGAEALVEDAQASILDGSVSGSKHVPSAPGEAPNNQTGRLHDSGFVGDLIEGDGTVQTFAGFDTPYAGYLEHGTSKMIERPFLSPATRRQQLPVFEALLGRFRQIVGLR